MYRGNGEIYTRSSAFIFFAFILFLAFPLNSSAKVTGVCSNCHTMHNSQDGSAERRSGAGVGWDNTPELTGGSLDTTPANNLLVTGCVGCHSSNTGNTIINKDGSKVPIVYNTVEPLNPLAGGNFYWSASDSTKGHNVYGIAGPDTLTSAPGRNPAGCANSCHDTLAAAPSSENSNRGGCQGCHVFTYHHEDNGVYRFLKGHGQGTGLPISPLNKDISSSPDYVEGIEDDDWEQETADDHNWYKGTDTAYISGGIGLKTYKTISSFCSGCHSVFHGPYDPVTKEGMGGGSVGNPSYPGSPWMRHPTDITLPDAGEYGNYDPDVAAQYDAKAPVAWKNLSETPSRSDAVVMCLSCHRPHGSDQPDMLRWNYNECNAGSSNPDCGCFTCHTEKDGS